MSQRVTRTLAFPKSPPRPAGAFADGRDGLARLDEEERTLFGAEVSGVQPAGGLEGDGDVDVDFEEPDLICALFEAMIDLDHAPSLLGAATFCVRALLGHVRPRAVFFHEYDASANDLVVLAAEGPGAEALVGARHPKSDRILSTALHDRRVAVFDEQTKEGALWSWRLFAVGPVDSVVVAPVLNGDRLVGVLEIASGADAARLGAREADGASYVAERLGELHQSRR
jgi:GAF domain-containing protein